MSNVYYKEKKSISDETSQFSSDIVTFENINKVFKSSYCGIGLTNPDIPFTSTSWRTSELFYNHENFGLIYIPKNIHFTDGKRDYYIALIDTKIDVISWQRRNSGTKDNGELIVPVVATQEEFNQVEISFHALIDYLGINKSIEEQYKKVKGFKLKRESINALIEILTAESNHDSLIDTVLSAAVKPVAFFKDNIQYLDQLEIDEPSKELYIFILINKLEKYNLVWTLDWKSSAEDINHAISKLSNGKITDTLDKKNDSISTPKMLKMASATLLKMGLKLLNVYTDTDSYTILLIQENKAEELIRVSKECKIKITNL